MRIDLERMSVAIVLAVLLAVISGYTDGTTVSKPSADEGAVSEYEKAFRENGSMARNTSPPSGLSLEEREKLAQEERSLSGFKNMSIDGYTYRIYGDVCGPTLITLLAILSALSWKIRKD